ncbi:FAD-binding oxidoreductase [Helicobacter aurati]|uniref:FAD-binding oxidoreductase n=2 Tax=Helicobacter aurati TaxID=137778 RepID=A0A3D8J6R9_9HELI|nr:FAD-binding oxidoreductase [Helicobacter aurati]
MQLQQLQGFGGYPAVASAIKALRSVSELQEFFSSTKSFIPHGNGRSYGDSALSESVLDCKPYSKIYSFCPECAVLHAQCGVTFESILSFSMQKGFFLHITPGTQYITLGGAIASNVHGKNHHYNNVLDSTMHKTQYKGGNFIESVLDFSLMLPNGEIKHCSRESHSDLFYATFGGMGLTGVILDARIRLQPVSSTYIIQTTIKTQNLHETLQSLESCQNSPYAVAWIDSLAHGAMLGRGLVTYGDFAKDNEVPTLQFQSCACSHQITNCQESPKARKLSIPCYFPNSTLNPLSVGIFNTLYYARASNGSKRVPFESFFYPLDSVLSWNKIYGRNGFLQYQCIIPKEHGLQALQKILHLIAMSKQASFLNVLKLYGKEDSSFLCFPLEGYSLALDFKRTSNVFVLLEKLDDIVIRHGGRLYLTKDSRMSKHTFESSYQRAAEFRKLRIDYNLHEKLQSLQSRRLGL